MKTNSPWWATQFDQQYLHEYEPLFDLTQDRREVARLMDVLELPSGARILDCPCGQGRHAHLLAEAGFDVDGLDYSYDLLAVARRRGTGKTLRYTQGDMRKLPARWAGAPGSPPALPRVPQRSAAGCNTAWPRMPAPAVTAFCA
jgi:2-polyprenyl-3-methyl-5-hydroxy-6-metoxy-1,4-benzoquinol methylase